MDREDLIQIQGPPEMPPEEITQIATTEDGSLYQLTYRLESIEPTEE